MLKKCLLLILIFALVFSASCLKQPGKEETLNKGLLYKLNSVPPPDSVNVKFKNASTSSLTSKSKTDILSKYPSKKKISKLNIYTVKTGAAKADEAVKALKKDPNVEFAELNRSRQVFDTGTQQTPDDPYYSRQYGLKSIGAPDGWDKETGQSNQVTIGIVDTGVDVSHPDLKSKIVPGYDFMNNDSDATDDHGHGTHVAGIASASTNNAVGVAGTSWYGKIMPVKVLDESGYGTDLSVSQGIIYAADHGAKVINLSLGGYYFSQTMQDATDYALSKDVVVLAAAGNQASSSTLYPAGNRNVLGVGAVDSSDKRAWFSNYNKSVDLSAPGVDVFSTYWNGSHTYAYLSGTSMATPFATGSVALLRSHFATGAPDIIDKQCKAVKDLGATGRDDYYGYGEIDLSQVFGEPSKIVTCSINKNSVVYGEKVSITGDTTPPEAGNYVTIRKKSAGSSKWILIGTIQTEEDGNFNISLKPSRNVVYRIASGSSAYDFRVKVKPNLTAALTGRKITGSVSPRSRRKIYLYKRRNNKYKLIAKKYTKGSYSFKLKKRGSYKVYLPHTVQYLSASVSLGYQ